MAVFAVIADGNARAGERIELAIDSSQCSCIICGVSLRRVSRKRETLPDPPLTSTYAEPGGHPVPITPTLVLGKGHSVNTTIFEPRRKNLHIEARWWGKAPTWGSEGSGDNREQGKC